MKLLVCNSGKTFLLPQDSIPLAQLLPLPGTKPLMEAFQFRSTAPAPDASGIEFHAGSLTVGDKTITVTRLHITLNSITINIADRTELVDAVFEQLTKALKAIKKDYTPDVRYTQEWSTCSVQLDFEFSKLFNEKFYGFMTKRVAAVSSNDTYKAIVQPQIFRAMIRYVATDPNQSATAPAQEIIFEPRAGSELSDRVYFSSALISSETHFKLLEELEREMK